MPNNKHAASRASVSTVHVMRNASPVSTALDTWLSGHVAKLNLLQSQAGLAKDSPTKAARERWEIVAGKLYLLSVLREELPGVLDSVPLNLTGEKPILPLIQGLYAEAIEACQNTADIGEPKTHADLSPQWHRADAERSLLRSLIAQLSGNAEEQPETREETARPAESSPAVPNPLDVFAESLEAAAAPVAALARAAASLGAPMADLLAKAVLGRIGGK